MEFASSALHSCCSLSLSTSYYSTAFQPQLPSLFSFQFSAPNLTFSSTSKVSATRKHNNNPASAAVSGDEGDTPTAFGDSLSSSDYGDYTEDERTMLRIDEDVRRHDELLDAIRKAPSELNEVIARRREDFTEEFFVHLYSVAQSYQDNPTEQNALAELGDDCVAAVQAYDFQTKQVTEFKHQNIVNSLGNLGAAIHSIDYRLVARWLQSCYRAKDIKRIHAVILKSFRVPVTYVDNNLIAAYLKSGNLVDAQKVFDKMPKRNVVSWTAMIHGYAVSGLDDEALRLFGEFVDSGLTGNYRTFVCMMNLCSGRLDFELGKQIHACIVKCNRRNLILDSSVVSFYAQCGDLTSAFAAFNGMEERDVVCWTSIITACSQQGYGDKAFQLLSQMLSEGFMPNEFTACGILKACGDKKALKFGRQLHGAFAKKMYKDDVFTGTTLVDMYGKCGEIFDSRRVFDGMKDRNTATWTSIIAAYARAGLGEEAISLFRVMKRRRVISNSMTVVSILRACGSVRALEIGREVHAQIIRNHIKLNEYMGTTLVWFYCKCGEFRAASRVFQQMPMRNVVSWTAIISGYACLGHETEALEFLTKMVQEGIEPNEFTYSSALKACANLEAVDQGKLIHSFTNKTPALSNVFVGSALIYMYSKCGCLSDAVRVFHSMPERNLIAWKTMILSYARNGLSREALKLMYQMQAEGIMVDDYILTSVMGAIAASSNIDRDLDSSSEYLLVPK